MKGFDLFSGIGGFHEGAKNLLKENFQAVAFCDFDEKSRIAYRSAYKDQAIIEFDDVNNITGELSSTILSPKKKSPSFLSIVNVSAVYVCIFKA